MIQKVTVVIAVVMAGLLGACAGMALAMVLGAVLGLETSISVSQILAHGATSVLFAAAARSAYSARHLASDEALHVMSLRVGGLGGAAAGTMLLPVADAWPGAPILLGLCLWIAARSLARGPGLRATSQE